eukprot:gene15204-17990_t
MTSASGWEEAGNYSNPYSDQQQHQQQQPQQMFYKSFPMQGKPNAGGHLQQPFQPIHQSMGLVSPPSIVPYGAPYTAAPPSTVFQSPPPQTYPSRKLCRFAERCRNGDECPYYHPKPHETNFYNPSQDQMMAYRSPPMIPYQQGYPYQGHPAMQYPPFFFQQNRAPLTNGKIHNQQQQPQNGIAKAPLPIIAQPENNNNTIAKHAPTIAATTNTTPAAPTSVEEQKGSKDTINKKDQSPVTVGDYTVQALVIDALVRGAREIESALDKDEYSIVAEEDAETLSAKPEVQEKVLEYFNKHSTQKSDSTHLLDILNRGNSEKPLTKRWWTLDPIDGTLGFLRRDQYAIALALMEDNVPVIGILGCPSLPWATKDPNGPKGCIFVAERGQGTVMRSLDGSNETKVSVSLKSDTTQAIFTESYVSRGFGHELNSKISKSLGVTAEPLRIDSQCKYAMVARGDSDVYLRLTQLDYQECIWDHAAGAIVVEEAGGVVTDFRGNKLDYSVGRKLSNNTGIAASNSNFSQPISKAIKESIQL